MKTALVLGGGGFIGHHLISSLKKEGYWVRGVDLKFPAYEKTEADDFVVGSENSPTRRGRLTCGCGAPGPLLDRRARPGAVIK